jgi:hypothetical protein
MLPSQTDADRVVAAYKDVSTAKCLAQVLPSIVKADLAQDGRVSSIKTTRVQPVKPVVGGAQSTYGYRLLLDAKIGGKAQRVYVDNWQVRVGRAVETLDFQQIGETFDTTIETGAADGATGRLATAVAGAPAAGESDTLAQFLPTVRGYTYEQAPDEVAQDLKEFVDANPDILSGASAHSVVDSQGATIAALTLLELRPEMASLPGFRAGSLEADAQDLAGDAGVAEPTQIRGQPAWLVTTGDGTLRLFTCKNVEVWVASSTEMSGTDADTFAAKFVDACL